MDLNIEFFTAEQYDTIKSWEEDCTTPKKRSNTETTTGVFGCKACGEYTADSLGVAAHVKKGDILADISCHTCNGELTILEIYQYDEKADRHYIALGENDDG